MKVLLKTSIVLCVMAVCGCGILAFDGVVGGLLRFSLRDLLPGLVALGGAIVLLSQAIVFDHVARHYDSEHPELGSADAENTVGEKSSVTTTESREAP